MRKAALITLDAEELRCVVQLSTDLGQDELIEESMDAFDPAGLSHWQAA